MDEWRKNQRFEDHLRPRLQGTSAREDFSIYGRTWEENLFQKVI
jgi:hypothetical protein